ncbi:MAG: hypothetical protein ABR577_10970 [Pyrinomonadaceae bacterium]
MIEDFGARVTSIWEGLRLTTRRLVERALQSTSNTSTLPQPARPGATPYDARADWEVGRLLAALDERAAEPNAALNDEQTRELRRMAETCAAVLQSGTQSAEIFAQLVLRAFHANDYARVDTLANALTARFAPSEICELARHPHALVRALAQEALAQVTTDALLDLLADPLDAEMARTALELQATEYNSEDARRILYALELGDELDDEA